MRKPGQNAEESEESVVVCVDTDTARAALVIEELSGVGVKVRLDGGLTSSVAWGDAAVLALSLSPEFPEETERTVQREALARATELGVRTIGYAGGLREVSLEQRCQFLLAGVEVLLDSDAANFAEELRKAALPAIERHQARREEQSRIDGVLRALGVVAASGAMRSPLRRLVRLAALGSAPVLLQGETGTGKEIAARILHACDPRRASGPFAPVNCAALSKTIAESQLFGHRRGAFSGAASDRPGIIRAADGGVLFLDEVGELDWELQGKLLRVLQEGRVLSVGDDRETAVDVRIVAATHRDLAGLVEAGRFRLDLFHRLAVIPVRLPPLRERPGDIPLLARHFAEKHSELCSGEVPALGPDFLDAIGCMQLSGNVRELENVMRSALAAREHSGPLSLRELPRAAVEEIAAHQVPRATHPSSHPPSRTCDWNLARALDSCERSLVEAALATSNGNQAAAAKLLGVTPRTIFNKVRRHGLKQHRA